MKYPMKYLLIDQTSFKGVLQLEVSQVIDILEVRFSIYELSFVTDSIKASLISNPSNEIVFNSLNKQFKGRSKASVIEAEQFHLYLKELLNTHSNYVNTDNFIKVIFPGKLVIYLTYFQIYSMNNFINQFVTSYEIMRLHLFKAVPEEVIVERAQRDTRTVEIPKEEKIEEEIITVDNVETDLVTLLSESLKLSPNNISVYYISKYIQQNISKTQENSIINDADIEISPLINPNLFNLSLPYLKDIITLLDSFSFSKEEYISKLILLTHHLNYTLKYYFESDDKDKAQELVILPLQIVTFLIFIYGLKLSNTDILPNINHNITKFTNHLTNETLQYIINKHMDRTKLTYINKYKRINLTTTTNNKNYKYIFNQLDDILKKERHSLAIDKELFISNVLKQYTNLDIDINDRNKEKRLKLRKLIHSPSIIDISKYISPIDSNISSYLTYNQISTEDTRQFKDRKIISQDYFDILRISITPKASVALLDFSKINPIISKHYNSIIDNIFKELSSMTLTEPISTLYLMEYFIKPFIEDSSVETDLFILFRLTIPYLYDLYSYKYFIDYFHS